MPIAPADGIPTRYEVIGSGPPLLMFSPGGFDSVQENWRTLGIYRRLQLLDQLCERYTCITFDRREAGESGGRLERLSWDGYAAQGAALLDQLGIEQAHLMGGCAGCSTVAAFAVGRPERTLSMVLYSPAGGVKYRMKQHERFDRHLAYVDEHGLEGVVALARNSDKGFSKDSRVGPWAPVLRHDSAFADEYARTDAGRYRILVNGIARLLYDRDTVPGAEPEDLLRLDLPALIVPGQDDSHAPSAARYLQECLPRSEYWDVPVAEQTESTAPTRVLRFLNNA